MVFGLGKSKKKVNLLAPFKGQQVGVEEVPDPVFAQKMVGDGFAVKPDESATSVEVCAPCAGKLAKVFKTHHAFALVSDEGLEVLVHIGLETVELKGAGFEGLAETGEHVEAGQPIVRVDLAAVRASGRNPITPVVCTKLKQIEKLELHNTSGAGATVTLA